MLDTVTTTATLAPELLWVDAEAQVAPFIGSLRDKYRITTAFTGDGALHHLTRVKPSLIVVDLNVSDVSGIELCRAAKSLNSPPAVLVTTDRLECVPDAIEAGCDGVLLKPFPPNLLHARIGRLLRARNDVLRRWGQRPWARNGHRDERTALLQAGTNRTWPDMRCVSCDHEGVTSFEFASHRRSWYACLACKHVWMDKRRE